MNSKIFVLTVTMMSLAISIPAQTGNASISPEQLALASIKNRVVKDDVNGWPKFQAPVSGINYWTMPIQLNDNGFGSVTFNIILPTTKDVILYGGLHMSPVAKNPGQPYGQEEPTILSSSLSITSGGTNINGSDLYLYDFFSAYGMKLRDAASQSVIVQIGLTGNIWKHWITSPPTQPSGAQSGIVVVYALETGKIESKGFAGIWNQDNAQAGWPPLIIQVNQDKAILSGGFITGPMQITSVVIGNELKYSSTKVPITAGTPFIYMSIDGTLSLSPDENKLYNKGFQSITDKTGTPTWIKFGNVLVKSDSFNNTLSRINTSQ